MSGVFCPAVELLMAAVKSCPYGVSGSTTRAKADRNKSTGNKADSKRGPVNCPEIFAKNSVIVISLRY
jgi:hypothetical protein